MGSIRKNIAFDPFPYVQSFFLPLILLLIIAVVFAEVPAKGQSNLDSLSKLIKKERSDTARINLLNKKVDSFIESNLDSAAKLGSSTIILAQKIKYLKGEAQARENMATIYSFQGNFTVAEQNLQAAKRIYIKLHDQLGMARLYSGYGLLYGMRAKYDSSVIAYKKSIAFAIRIKNDKLLNRAYQNIAISYQMLSNYSQALSYFQKALMFSERQHDYNSQSYIWLNMGLTYNLMDDLSRGRQALNKAIFLAKKEKIRNVELYAYSNLAVIYSKERKHQLAYEYALKAIVIGRETGDLGITAASMSKAVNALADMGKLKQAYQLGLKALVVADSSKQPYNIFQVYAAIGNVLKREGLYKQAIPYLEKGFAAMKGSDIVDESNGNAYADLSACYEQTGDYRKSLQAYKRASEITDSIRSVQNVRKATELNMNYEFDKKQQLQHAEKEKQDAANKVKQVILFAGLMLFVLLFIVSVIAYGMKQRANRLLKSQKEELESTLLKLKNAQKQLVQSEKMASLGELTAGIAHEIQNPLNFVNNFSEVSMELTDEISSQPSVKSNAEAISLASDIKLNLGRILYHGRRADSIVKGMLLHSNSNSGERQQVDLNALAEEYLRLSYHGLRAKDKTFNAGFSTDFKADLPKVSISPQEIGRVLLNIYNNAFYAVKQKQKNAEDTYKPFVEVSTRLTTNAIEIRIKDNGTGIPETVKDKIFQPFFTTKPTGEGSGLGLSISYDIINKGYGGTIGINSQEGEFTEFIIMLPQTLLA
jgi:two-component system NtrC family sensor kinase